MVFLKDPNVVARTTEIFLERLRTTPEVEVMNHDDAEADAIDYPRGFLIDSQRTSQEIRQLAEALLNGDREE